MSEVGPEKQSPARFRFYKEIDELYAQHRATLEDKLVTLCGKKFIEDKDPFIAFNTSYIREPLDLPSLGTDEAVLDSVYSVMLAHTQQVRSFICMNLSVYKNGQEFIAEKDMSVTDRSNYYCVLASPEMPPTIVHSDYISHINTDAEDFSKANKIFLTDEECEEIVDFIDRQTPSVEELDLYEDLIEDI